MDPINEHWIILEKVEFFFFFWFYIYIYIYINCNQLIFVFLFHPPPPPHKKKKSILSWRVTQHAIKQNFDNHQLNKFVFYLFILFIFIF